MKKKIPHLVMLLMLSVSLCIPYSVQAFMGRNTLNLTDEQKAELREIGEATWEEIEPLLEGLATLRDEMEAILVASEEIDIEAANAISEEINEVRSAIMSIRASAKLQSAQVLTLEQRELIIDKKKEIRERMEKGIEEKIQRREKRDEGIDLSF